MPLTSEALPDRLANIFTVCPTCGSASRLQSLPTWPTWATFIDCPMHGMVELFKKPKKTVK